MMPLLTEEADIVTAAVLQMLTVTFYESEPSLTSIINIFSCYDRLKPKM